MTREPCGKKERKWLNIGWNGEGGDRVSEKGRSGAERSGAERGSEVAERERISAERDKSVTAHVELRNCGSHFVTRTNRS